MDLDGSPEKLRPSLAVRPISLRREVPMAAAFEPFDRFFLPDEDVGQELPYRVSLGEGTGIDLGHFHPVQDLGKRRSVPGAAFERTAKLVLDSPDFGLHDRLTMTSVRSSLGSPGEKDDRASATPVARDCTETSPASSMNRHNLRSSKNSPLPFSLSVIPSE